VAHTARPAALWHTARPTAPWLTALPSHTARQDTLYNDLIDICAMSASAVVQALFPEATTKKDKKRPTTAGFKIKTSINELVNTLNLCSPHYIRCLKPNDQKRSSDFDEKRCLHQVRVCVRVRVFHPHHRRFNTWGCWRTSGSAAPASRIVIRIAPFSSGSFSLHCTCCLSVCLSVRSGQTSMGKL
jgi:hypothetical protein